MKGFESFPSPATEQRERPKKLYHASPVADLEQIKPQARSVRDAAEGPRVFATPDKAYATVFLFENDSRWVQHGKMNGIPYILIAKDRAEFMEEDQGGVMYELSSDGFLCDPHKGMGHDEWTHVGVVEPRVSERKPSALDAMLEAGVQVYFVDGATLRRFQSSVEEHEAVFRSLTSENEKRGMNVRSFEVEEGELESQLV